MTLHRISNLVRYSPGMRRYTLARQCVERGVPWSSQQSGSRSRVPLVECGSADTTRQVVALSDVAAKTSERGQGLLGLQPRLMGDRPSPLQMRRILLPEPKGRCKRTLTIHIPHPQKSA